MVRGQQEACGRGHFVDLGISKHKCVTKGRTRYPNGIHYTTLSLLSSSWRASLTGHSFVRSFAVLESCGSLGPTCCIGLLAYSHLFHYFFLFDDTWAAVIVLTLPGLARALARSMEKYVYSCRKGQYFIISQSDETCCTAWKRHGSALTTRLQSPVNNVNFWFR